METTIGRDEGMEKKTRTNYVDSMEEVRHLVMESKKDAEWKSALKSAAVFPVAPNSDFRLSVLLRLFFGTRFFAAREFPRGVFMLLWYFYVYMTADFQK